MHSENENVAVRAAEALLDRGYGRPMQGMHLSGGERPVPRVIHVEFVTPPKRDEDYSIRPPPCLTALPQTEIVIFISLRNAVLPRMRKYTVFGIVHRKEGHL